MVMLINVVIGCTKYVWEIFYSNSVNIKPIVFHNLHQHARISQKTAGRDLIHIVSMSSWRQGEHLGSDQVENPPSWTAP